MRAGSAAAAVRYLAATLLTAVLTFLTESVWAWLLQVFLLLIPIVSFCCGFSVRKSLTGQIKLPTTAAKNTDCEGCVLLKNNSLLPVSMLHCRVRILNDLTGQSEVLTFSASVGAKQEAEMQVKIRSDYCGRLYVSLEQLWIYDWFGLAALKAGVKASARMTVLPDLFTCEPELGAVASSSEDGTADRRGDDRTEVYQLREYREGDDVRQIHWKLSSKLDNLILREAGQSISRSVLVFWDKRFACRAECMDALAETTASLCQGLMDKGIAFDLGWTEGEEPELREIRDEDTMLQTIPALVTQTGHPDCRIPELNQYGRVLYLCSRQPEEIRDMQVFFLICSGEEGEGRNALYFPPVGYQERLERLEI